MTDNYYSLYNKLRESVFGHYSTAPQTLVKIKKRITVPCRHLKLCLFEILGGGFHSF
jgi:hypothetical protein